MESRTSYKNAKIITVSIINLRNKFLSFAQIEGQVQFDRYLEGVSP